MTLFEMKKACPEPFMEGCKIVDPNGDAQTCPNLRDDGVCEWDITDLTEARRFLEQSDDTSKELRFSALRDAVEKIIEHLENREAEG